MNVHVISSSPGSVNMSIDKFELRNNTLIVSTGKITAMEVRKYLEHNIKNKSFVKGSKFKIYAGSHGDEDGKLSQRDITLLDGIVSALSWANNNRELEGVIEEMGYEIGDPTFVGKTRKIQNLEYDHKRVITSHFDEIIERNHPYVLFLAYCFTYKNELTEYMGEMGVISVCNMKNDRGAITNGRWFKLDVEQAGILEQARDYHKCQGNTGRYGIWDGT